MGAGCLAGHVGRLGLEDSDPEWQNPSPRDTYMGPEVTPIYEWYIYGLDLRKGAQSWLLSH